MFKHGKADANNVEHVNAEQVNTQLQSPTKTAEADVDVESFHFDVSMMEISADTHTDNSNVVYMPEDFVFDTSMLEEATTESVAEAVVDEKAEPTAVRAESVAEPTAEEKAKHTHVCRTCESC